MILFELFDTFWYILVLFVTFWFLLELYSILWYRLLQVTTGYYWLLQSLVCAKNIHQYAVGPLTDDKIYLYRSGQMKLICFIFSNLIFRSSLIPGRPWPSHLLLVSLLWWRGLSTDSRYGLSGLKTDHTDQSPHREMEKAYKTALAKFWAWKISTPNMCKKFLKSCKISKNCQKCTK